MLTCKLPEGKRHHLQAWRVSTTSCQEEGEDAPQQEAAKEDKLMLRSQGLVDGPKLGEILSGASNPNL